MSTKALKLTSLLLLLLLVVVAPLHAASGSISIVTAFTPTGQTPGDCNDVVIEYRLTLTGDTDDDGLGGDWIAVAITDGNGRALATEVGPIAVGNDLDVGVPLITLRPEGITARPITIALYDTGDGTGINPNTIEAHNFAVAGTLRAQTVIDPATLTVDGSCESLPFIGGSTCLTLPTGSVVGNTPYQTQVYWSPVKVSPGIFLNPGNYWVIGTDDSGKFYKIMLSCAFVWVPVEDFQPSFEAPWSGQPLPTTVVK